MFSKNGLFSSFYIQNNFCLNLNLSYVVVAVIIPQGKKERRKNKTLRVRNILLLLKKSESFFNSIQFN